MKQLNPDSLLAILMTKDGELIVGSKLAAKLMAVSVGALVLSGCAGTASETNPAWDVSLSQSSNVDVETIAALNKAIPQYSHGGYTATFVPLSESIEGDKRVTKFALKADLPDNCITPDKLDFNAEVDQNVCLSFLYLAAGPKVQDVKRGYAYRPASDGGTEYLDTTKGSSILTVTAPADAETLLVNLQGAGRSAVIDPMTGSLVHDYVSETVDPVPAAPEPDAPAESVE